MKAGPNPEPRNPNADFFGGKMAGATYVLDKTYKVTEAAGVTKYRAVIPGTNDGECKLPTAANQLSYGITQEAQSKQNENVTVRKYGISRAYAKGTVAKGDYLEVGDATGALRKADLATVPGAATLHHVLGVAETSAAAGEIFFVFLSPNPPAPPGGCGGAAAPAPGAARGGWGLGAGCWGLSLAPNT